MPHPVDIPTKAGGVIYRIGKTFQFAASHQLTHLPEGHKCKRLHGHTYSVSVTLATQTLNEDGFVVDFAELDQIGAFIRENLDHQHLNAVLAFMPTCELIAQFIAEKFQALPIESVRVSESPSTWAEYRRAV